MKNQKLKVGAKAGMYSVILTVIVLAAAIVVNLIVGALPSKYTKIDTTSDKVFTFSETTEKFISSLEDDVKIYYVCEDGAEDTYLSKALERFKEMSSHISVEQVSPSTQPALIEKYVDESTSLASNSLIVTSGETSKVVSYGDIYYIYCEVLGGKISYDEFNSMNQQYYNYYGMSLEQYYAQSTGSTLQYSVNFAGEGAILSGIDYVTTDDLPKIYVLGADEEVTLNSVLSSIFKQSNYIVEPLTLSESSTGLDTSASVYKEIPEDADTILILGVMADISDQELSTLQGYVADGGNLIVATDYTSPKYENLRKLASTYGLDIATSVVLESEAANYSGAKFKIKAQSGGVLADFGYDIIVPQAHGIKVSETMPEGMSATELLYTSGTAYAKPLGFDTSGKLDKAEGDIEGKLALAVNVTCEGAGTVSWFASDYYLLGDVQGYSSDYNNHLIYNYAYAANLASVCGKVETVTADAIELSSAYLSVTDGSANLWGIITIGIVPLAFIGVGFAVWLRRRSK